MIYSLGVIYWLVFVVQVLLKVREITVLKSMSDKHQPVQNYALQVGDVCVISHDVDFVNMLLLFALKYFTTGLDTESMLWAANTLTVAHFFALFLKFTGPEKHEEVTLRSQGLRVWVTTLCMMLVLGIPAVLNICYGFVFDVPLRELYIFTTFTVFVALFMGNLAHEWLPFNIGDSQ